MICPRTCAIAFVAWAFSSGTLNTGDASDQRMPRSANTANGARKRVVRAPRADAAALVTASDYRIPRRRPEAQVRRPRGLDDVLQAEPRRPSGELADAAGIGHDGGRIPGPAIAHLGLEVGARHADDGLDDLAHR